MPLVLNYADTRETENDILCELIETDQTSGLQFTSSNRTYFFPYPRSLSPLSILRYAIEKMAEERMDTVSFVIPKEWIMNKQFITNFGEVCRETQWDSHPTHVLTLVCETFEMFNMVNGYFQGTWHL